MSAFDPYHKWLGIPPKDQPPHCYRLLGIDLFEADPEVIEAAANRQMTYVQGAASGERVAESQKLMKEITQARIVLLDKDKRAVYDAKLKQKLAATNLKVAPSLERAEPPPPPPAVSRPAIKPAAPKSPPKRAAKLGGNPLDLGLQTAPTPGGAARGTSQKKVQLGWQFPFFIVAVLLIVAGGIAMWWWLPGMLQQDETLLADAEPAPLQTAAPLRDAGTTGEPNLPAEPLPSNDDSELTPAVETNLDQSDAAEGRRPDGEVEPPAEAPTSDTTSDPPFELPEESTVPGEDTSATVPRLGPGGLDDGSTFPDTRAGGVDPLTGESLDDLIEKIDGTGGQPPTADPLEDPLADPPDAAVGVPDIERQPVPADLLLRDARRQLADEIARPPKGMEAAAAAKLLDRVRAGQDDAARQFVLLEVAQEFAVAAHDVAFGLEVAQQRAARFEVDPLDVQTDLIYDFSRTLAAKDHEAIRSVKQAGGPLLDNAIREHRYDLADRILKSLRTLGKRLRDAEFDQFITKYQDDVAAGLNYLDVIRHALSVLETDADDPEANLTMGSFYAAVRDEWTAAAPYLMKADNEALQAAAALELSVPTDAAAQYRIVETWRTAAEHPEVDRRLADAAGRHSKHWLLLAWNNAEGDLRDQIQKELIDRQMLFENSVGMLFMRIPAGQFLMGSPTNEEDRGSTFKYRKSIVAGAKEQVVTVEVSETLHPVRITTPIFFGVYEVTQHQYESVKKTKPSEFEGANLPVENVHWDNAMGFCRALTEMEHEKTPGLVYRLPTEAEWEYACRAGTQTPFSFGDHLTDVHAAIQPEQEPRPVGSYAPNAFGLFDMHGNVMEWVYDEFDPNFYDRLAAQEQVAVDPRPRETLANRFKIARGGSYRSPSADCRSAARKVLPREAVAGYIGFRVVLVQLRPKR